jgi:hypothetical protein
MVACSKCDRTFEEHPSASCVKRGVTLWCKMCGALDTLMGLSAAKAHGQCMEDDSTRGEAVRTRLQLITEYEDACQ